jgi:hypothetical protein
VASAKLEAVDPPAFDGAQPPTPKSPAELLRLAGLTDLDGVDLNELEGRLRRLTRALHGADALRRLTVRALLVATLKAAKVSGAAGLADAAIGESDEPRDVAASPFLADEVPWPSRVVGDGLLDTLVVTVRRYVVLPTVHAARAIALWVVLTYCEPAVNLLPLLLVTSPTKRCGKTRLVELVGARAAPCPPATSPPPRSTARSIRFIQRCCSTRGIRSSTTTRSSAASSMPATPAIRRASSGAWARTASPRSSPPGAPSSWR